MEQLSLSDAERKQKVMMLFEFIQQEVDEKKELTALEVHLERVINSAVYGCRVDEKSRKGIIL